MKTLERIGIALVVAAVTAFVTFLMVFFLNRLYLAVIHFEAGPVLDVMAFAAVVAALIAIAEMD